MELSKQESNFMRLVHVEIKLRVVYEQFPKLPHNTSSERLFRSLTRENIIIYLYNFIKIRNDLIKDPKIKLVDESVKPLWETIIKFQEPINQIRHEYIAHIQEGNRRFKKPINEIMDEYEFPTQFGNILFMAGCILIYCDVICVNFETQWKHAIKKHRAMSPTHLRYGTIKIAHVSSKLKQISDDIATNLKQNKLQIHRKTFMFP